MRALFYFFLSGVFLSNGLFAGAVPEVLRGLDVLIVTHHSYAPDHHNTHDMFPSYPGEFNSGSYKGGGAIKVLHFGEDSVRVTTLAETADGLYRDPDLSYDAVSLVVSYRKDFADSYHIYAYDLSPAHDSFLCSRRLTSLFGADDLHPTFLPSGEVVFASTRDPKYVMCNRHISANIYRMEADGANAVKITNSTLFERPTDVLPDGRILYDRWEYSDRDFGSAQGLWSVYPDGTRQQTYYGNNSPTGAAIFGRVVPGSSYVAAILSSTHDRPWGGVALLDRGRGVDGAAPVIRTWPSHVKNGIREPGQGNQIDAYTRLSLKYTTPAPLDASHILVAGTIPGRGEKTGLYLINTTNDDAVLLYEDPSELGVYDPTPLRPRAKPAIQPNTRNYLNESGTFLVQNVYNGTHMAGVEPGSVKALRVVESLPKRAYTRSNQWGGEGQQNPGMNWHSFEAKRILGCVPVYPDGSAYFTVPQDRFIYFQLLDADGRLIQSMRSGALIQSGETFTCLGCHDDRTAAPAAPSRRPQALAKPPVALTADSPPYNYLSRVQPIFTQNCISCHGYEKPAADLTLVPDKGPIFNASYVDLWRGRNRKGVPFGNLLGAVGAGNTTFYPPRAYGSAISPLILILENDPDHRKCVTAEELGRIREWVDINAPYYPDYTAVYPEGTSGRGPLTYSEVKKIPGFQWSFGWGERRPQPIHFDNPEKSPLLATLSPENREKALALIREGHNRLKAKPDIDWAGFTHMPGNPAVPIAPYKPHPIDAWRLEKTALREQLENVNRAAVQNGTKHYDSDSPALAWPARRELP